MDDKGQEPSMEDILASIRKILSEDEEAEAGSGTAAPDGGQASAEAAASGDDVLELTPSMAEEEDVPLVLEEPPPAATPEPEPAPASSSPPVEEMESAPKPEAPPPPASDASLLSPPAAAQSVAAFSELANVARVKNVGVGPPDITLEAIVRDMIRPMLASWLEQNLPDMVERLVRKEIERLVSGAEK